LITTMKKYRKLQDRLTEAEKSLERAEAANYKLQKILKNVQDVINLWESRIIGNLKAISTLAAYLSPDEKDKN